MGQSLQNFDPALKDKQGRKKMPAVSKAQQRFFGGWQHNPEKMKGKRPDMTVDQMEDFSATKTKGLPEHKSPVKAAMKKAMRKKGKK